MAENKASESPKYDHCRTLRTRRDCFLQKNVKDVRMIAEMFQQRSGDCLLYSLNSPPVGHNVIFCRQIIVGNDLLLCSLI